MSTDNRDSHESGLQYVDIFTQSEYTGLRRDMMHMTGTKTVSRSTA